MSDECLFAGETANQYSTASVCTDGMRDVRCRTSQQLLRVGAVPGTSSAHQTCTECGEDDSANQR